MYYRRAYCAVVHVVRKTFYGRTGFYWKVYLAGEHVLNNSMYIRRSCVTGEHVLWVYMFHMNECFKYYWETCFSGCHVQCEYMSHWKSWFAGNVKVLHGVVR